MKATDARALATAIQILAGTFNKDIVSITLCNVTSVNEDEFTCDCEAIGGDADTSIPGVYLNSEQNDGFTLVPKVDSTVLVASSSRSKYFVFKVEEIDKVICVIDANNKFTFSSSGFIWNDGTNGGLINIVQQTAKLNAMISQITANFPLISTCLATLGQVYTPVVVATINPSDFEDNKIKH